MLRNTAQAGNHSPNVSLLHIQCKRGVDLGKLLRRQLWEIECRDVLGDLLRTACADQRGCDCRIAQTPLQSKLRQRLSARLGDAAERIDGGVQPCLLYTSRCV